MLKYFNVRHNITHIESLAGSTQPETYANLLIRGQFHCCTSNQIIVSAIIMFKPLHNSPYYV